MAVPIALTIAGSDSSGGAGIQADLKTFSALGVYGASVITALTAQNTKGVAAIHDVPADFIAAQMDAVFSDLDVGAVKIGMLGSAAADRRRRRRASSAIAPRNVVLDPVMVATSGDELLRADAMDGAAGADLAGATCSRRICPKRRRLLDAPLARDEDARCARRRKSCSRSAPARC